MGGRGVFIDTRGDGDRPSDGGGSQERKEHREFYQTAEEPLEQNEI